MNPTVDSVPRSFIRCPVDGAVWAGIYETIAARLRKDSRWRVIEPASNHLAPLVAPDELAGALISITKRVPQPERHTAQTTAISTLADAVPDTGMLAAAGIPRHGAKGERIWVAEAQPTAGQLRLSHG